MKIVEYTLVGIAIVIVLAVAACRWGGARIEANVPIYGNATLIFEPVVIDGGEND